MLPHHTSGQPRYPSSSASSPLPSRHQQSTSRYHPYMSLRRCRFTDDSVSPSPPAMAIDCTGWPPIVKGVDYLSSLPQELIEEIGLMTCATPYTGDPSQLFQAERHRVRSLWALCLVSKQFNQVFTRPLYMEPLIIDTQHARSLRQPNSAMSWLSPSCHDNASVAKRFTLWRPQSEEMKKGCLCPINPFVMLFMLTNVRELTFAGNYKNRPLKDGYSQSRPWSEATLVPQYVPHLTSVRLIDVDDPELINILLVGIAHQLTSMVVQPASTGATDSYSPRSVYSSMRQTLEKLNALETFSLSLPGLKGSINHCNHAHKLIQKSLVNLPNKEKVLSLSLALPPFDCRSVSWADASDSEDDLDPKSVDHAWFWMTLQTVLSEFTNLKIFEFTGSSIPEEVRRKLQSCCASAKMSFFKADKVQNTSSSYTPVLPTVPFAIPAPVPDVEPSPPPPTNPLFPVFSFASRTHQPITTVHHQSPAPWLQGMYAPYREFATFTASPAPTLNYTPPQPRDIFGGPSFRDNRDEVTFTESRTESIFRRAATPIPDDEDDGEFDGLMDVDPQGEWDWFIQYD